MRHILFVTNDAWYFTSHRLPIAAALVNQGVRVTVCAKKDYSVSAIQAAGCEFIDWDLDPRGKNFSTEIRSILSLHKIVRHVKPDLVHLITIKAVLYGTFISRLSGVKHIVCSIAGMGALLETRNLSITQKWIRHIYKSILSSRKIWMIFQNPGNRQEITTLLGRTPKNVLIRGSGVNLDHYTYMPESANDFKVVMAARLLKDKGVREYISAAKALSKKHTDVVFLLAGDNAGIGNPAAFNHDELNQIYHNPYIKYVGHCTDVANLYTQSHIIVLPSYHEGLPKSLIEAAACGRPVVTTEAPGCLYAITRNVTGLAVPIGDSNALANAIEKLILDDSLRQSMGTAGRQLAEQEFGIDKIVRLHLNLYKEISLT